MNKSKRVLLKLSGETLSSNTNCVDVNSVQEIVNEIKPVLDKKIQGVKLSKSLRLALEKKKQEEKI